MPLAELQYFGIVRAQLAAEVRAAQSELTGYLRNIVLDIVHAVTRRDGLLVFGMGVGTLPAPLAYLDVDGFFLTALDAVAFQHQMTMIDTDITGKSAGGYSALSAYLRSREVGGSI